MDVKSFYDECSRSLFLAINGQEVIISLDAFSREELDRLAAGALAYKVRAAARWIGRRRKAQAALEKAWELAEGSWA